VNAVDLVLNRDALRSYFDLKYPIKNLERYLMLSNHIITKKTGK